MICAAKNSYAGDHGLDYVLKQVSKFKSYDEIEKTALRSQLDNARSQNFTNDFKTLRLVSASCYQLDKNKVNGLSAVSYTHLTLPTILLV